MEFLIGFIGSLIKIGILASIYALFIVLVFKAISKKIPNSQFRKILEKKSQLWLVSGLIISLLLFIYLFTYSGNHGFGDGPRIPIGHGVIMDNTNWDQYGYIRELQTSDSMNVETTTFKVKNNILCGNLDSGFYDYKNLYFVYDLQNKSLLEFKSQKDYEYFATKHNLPLPNEFKSFRENYWDYWGGWRLILLP